MSEASINTIDFNSVEEIDLAVDESTPKSVMAMAILLQAFKAQQIKNEVSQMAAEVQQRQDKIKFLHDIIQTINRYTDELTGLDINKCPELIEKLQVAKELGVEIPEDKLQLSMRERDYLLENLRVTADHYDWDNKMQIQKMQVMIQESDRFIMLANHLMKKEDRSKSNTLEKIK